ncbi:snapalysin [Streptomyces sp. bgisy029]|uniref:snapalysin n=1 Tax=unclassified Streptomyces TaxID=2593676 RepID=UPI003D744E94
MRHLRTAIASAIAGLGLVAALGTAPAVSAAPAPAVSTPATIAAYNGSAENAAANKAFFDAVMKSAAEKRAAAPIGTQAVTVTYSAASAPSFRTQIANSTRIWNSSVSNVRLQEGSNADFTYREGNDPRGSYASTNGHGRGFIFLDYRQNQQYNSTRVTTHETGHVLGLPDTYSGPCSQLMSGGGPGPSCTNAQPDANERSRVNYLWRNGFAAALAGATS